MDERTGDARDGAALPRPVPRGHAALSLRTYSKAVGFGFVVDAISMVAVSMIPILPVLLTAILALLLGTVAGVEYARLGRLVDYLAVGAGIFVLAIIAGLIIGYVVYALIISPS